MDGASLSIISKIKSNTTNPQEKEEYEMYLDLIQCQSPNDVPKLNDYETFTNEQFIKEIIKNLNISKKTFKKSKEFDLIPENLKELPKFIETYITDSYVFTFDNYIKLMLIMIRFRANIPVILMGETGCGKTFLVRTISKLLGIDIKILNIHAGVLENDIINFLERYNLFEDQNIKISKTWVFLDEINTCDVLGLISEIMIKHSANGRSITKNAFFIGACNPYRVKTTNKDDNSEASVNFFVLFN
jgi:midasin (ATPase involved in ribosome maturation)